MQELSGKTAFITGGASGIGLAMARAFLGAGMRVVIADIDQAALDAAEQALRGANAEVLAVRLDVTDRNQFAAVADHVEATFGPVHVLCNNAGVYRGGPIGAVTYADWDWIMGVNVGGVINGVQTFVERMQRHGEGGHVVNTASMAGVTTSPGLGVYNTSKFAVVGLSEAMRADLEPHGIGVSVLCPGMVRTRILESERTRPRDLDVDSETANEAARAHSEIMQLAMGSGIDADEVAEVVLNGVRDNTLYLFPHPEMKPMVEARQQALIAAFGEPDPERVRAQQVFIEAAGLAPPTAH